MGEWLELFDRLADLHRRLVLAPLWEGRFPGHAENPWASLALFLVGYGIGRASPSDRLRSGAGAEALARASGRAPYRNADRAAGATWRALSGLDGPTSGNPRLHPLYPSADPAALRVRPRPSLPEVRYVGDVAGYQASLTDFAGSLVERDDAGTVFDLLVEVRGVSGNRVRRFLRDLRLWTGLATGPGVRFVPADELLRTAVPAIAGRTAGAGSARRWLADESRRRGLPVHRVSAGLSYFADEIAGDPLRMESCLDDLSLALRLEEDHRARLATCV